MSTSGTVLREQQFLGNGLFGVSWQDTMARSGIVGNEIDITMDAEAILEDN